MLDEKSNFLKNLLMQVNTPIYAVQTDDGGIDFISEDNDFFFSAYKENSGICIKAFVPSVPLKNLGDIGFKKRHALTYPYIAGAMANGISSAAMVKPWPKMG